MQAVAGRDRIYVLTLVLTLVAICAFGVFVIRDYQDQGSQKVGPARTTSGGDSSLPSTGDTGSAAAQGTTGTSGTSAVSSGSAGGTSAGASAGTSAGSSGASAGSSAGSV